MEVSHQSGFNGSDRMPGIIAFTLVKKRRPCYISKSVFGWFGFATIKQQEMKDVLYELRT